VIAPIAHFWIVLAKALGATLAAVLHALLLLIVLAVLGFVSSQVSVPILATGILATGLVCASIGMLIAAWARSIDNFATLMNFVIFPVFFLSGSLYPVRELPPALQIVAALNPYTYGVDLLKHSEVAGAAAGFRTDFSLGLDLAVLLGFSAVALAVASLRFSHHAVHEPLVRGLARTRAE
jgi:ABC-2 type transport system permease protein